MGVYDTVWVKCPKCGEESGFQSKSGECILRDYTLKNCPNDVMMDINRHSPNTCRDCGTVFEVNVLTRKVVIK
jgi:ribosomal protein L37E